MKLLKKRIDSIDTNKLPHHIAFIIDGNGRWAKKRGMPRMFGHRAGIEAVKNTINYCLDIGIKETTFFCFSTENWNRPKEEIDGLFNLFREFGTKNTEEFIKKDIKIIVIGNRENIPQDVVKIMEELEEKTKNCTALKVCICINYGGRYDIVNAVNNIIKDGKNHITEQEFSGYLLTKYMRDPDLIIRSSGEIRVSNYLLYQMAYSEFYFTKTYWPDFNKKELTKAIIDFQKRNRRFGAIKE